MKLAIVAYPTLDDRDRAWIESIRQTHDPQAARIAVHFTLVFPVEVSPDDLTAELSAAAAIFSPIPFTIGRLEVVPDLFGRGHQLFLVPDEGAPQITALHARLYAGVLKPHLRADIPFMPHMTIAAAPDALSCERLASEFASAPRTIAGEITAFDLVDVSQASVKTLRAYALNS